MTEAINTSPGTIRAIEEKSNSPNIESGMSASPRESPPFFTAIHQNNADIINKAPETQPLWVIISRISCRSAGCNRWRIDSINSSASFEGRSSFAAAARPC